MSTFAEIVDSADALSHDEQQTLIDILQARLRERRREELLKGIQEAEAEFSEGKIQPASVDEIMKRIRS